MQAEHFQTLPDVAALPLLGLIVRVKLGDCSIGKQVHGPDVAGHLADVRVAQTLEGSQEKVARFALEEHVCLRWG